MLVFVMSVQVSAASTTYDSLIVRRADLPTVTYDGKKCFGAQAMGVSRGKNCLYSIKIDGDDSIATMYYFPDISKWNDKVHFIVYGIGHANGMTVDTNYIYIYTGEAFVRINRSYISALADGSVIDVKTNSNCKILVPKKVNPDEKARETTPYVNYLSTIYAVSRDTTTNNFIVYTKIKNIADSEYNGFRRASIKDGEFVISTENDDIFLVKNNLAYSQATRQDICYVSGSGLFIGKWYGASADSTLQNLTKNVILWADIDNGAYTYYERYKCYTPDKIRVDMTNYVDSETGVKMYEKFEIESIGITAKKNLVASFNVIYTDAYKSAKGLADKEDDGIYKITKTDGSTFVLN